MDSPGYLTFLKLGKVKDMFSTHVISTVHEGVKGDWLYHFCHTKKGVYVKRTSASDPLWSHGTLTQWYDKDAGRFIPQCNVLTTDYFVSVFEAKLAIQKVL